MIKYFVCFETKKKKKEFMEMKENLVISYNYVKDNKIYKGMHWISLTRSNSIFIVEMVGPIKRAAFLPFARKVKSRKVCKETTESRKKT